MTAPSLDLGQLFPISNIKKEPVREQRKSCPTPALLPPNLSPALAPPSSAAIGFDFLVAVWSLHTFNKLCHFAVQTRDTTDKPGGLVCGIKDLIRIDQSLAKALGPSASENALQCHTSRCNYSC